jgi:hypothetical protein
VGPLAVLAFVGMFMAGGGRPTEVQFAQGILTVIYSAMGLVVGLAALVIGYVIKWSTTESRLGRRWFP